MVQTRSQVARRRSAVRSRLRNMYIKAANYRNINPLLRSSNASRRVGYILNAAQKIGSAYQKYYRRKVATQVLSNRLPTDVARYISKYIS